MTPDPHPVGSFVAVKTYSAARRRFPRAAVICRDGGGYRAFACLDDWYIWRRLPALERGRSALAQLLQEQGIIP
jgi:hypothetical protein